MTYDTVKLNGVRCHLTIWNCDKYGSHLNAQGVTFDSDLESKIFKFAGEALAEIWSDGVIDGYDIIAEYIDSNNSEIEAESIKKKNAE